MDKLNKILKYDLFAWLSVKSCPNNVLRVLIFSTIAINLLTLAFPLALLQTYDRIIPNNATDTLLVLVLSVIVAMVMETILRIARMVIGTWADAKFVYKTACDAFNHLTRVKQLEYTKAGAGVHLERINALNNFKDFYSGQALIILMDLPFALLYLVIMAYISIYMIIVPVIMIVLYVIRAYLTTDSLKKEIENKRAVNNRRANFLIEILASMHTIKSLAMEALMLRRYERIQQSFSVANYQINTKSLNTQVFSQVLSQISMIGVASVGAILAINGEITIGALAACVLLSGRCLQPVVQTLGMWNRLQTIKVAEDSVKNIFNLPTFEKKEGGLVITNPPEIKLESIFFNYEDDEKTLLDDITLTIPANQLTAFIGEDTNSKSALLSIINGTLEAESGDILLDNKSIDNYTLQTLREQVSYIPQDSALLKGTILDNLIQFQDRHNIKYAKAIAEVMGLDELITKLPNGYNTQVGGTNVEFLPHGLKHLIIIARALFKDSKIILFDDSDTTFDPQTSAIILNLLTFLKKEHTVVLSSNNKKLLELADKQYELKDGKLLC